jgi:hypothetical protein
MILTTKLLICELFRREREREREILCFSKVSTRKRKNEIKNYFTCRIFFYKIFLYI